MLQCEELEDTKGVVKIVSSECDAYSTVSTLMVDDHLVKHHEI